MRATVFVAAAALLAARPAGAASTVINFENLPAGTTVTNQYAAQGLTFFSAYVQADSGARSGTRVLRSRNPATGSDPGPLRIDFAAGQRYVKVHAGTLVGNTRGTLKAFDAQGNVLDQDGEKAVTTGDFAVAFQVRASAAAIRRVELLYESGVIVDVTRALPSVPAADPPPFEGIDDLEFSTDPPPPAPVAALTAPADGAELTARNVAVRGTITGQEIVSPVKLRHQWTVKPGSFRTSAGETSLTVALSGGSFSVNQALEIGPQTFTVRATNAGGLQGSATVQVNYLPSAIRTRFEAEGGAAVFGSFSFGEEGGTACTYAVYREGAIALSGSRTRVIRGPLFDKWLSLEDGGHYPRLGCPTSEQRTVAGDVSAQDFEHGRLYGDAGGTYYVNPVFVQAIDVLGGEAATGTPTGDPTSDSRSPFLVWQFQQFRKLDAVGQRTLRSTLQIQGPYTAPRLYVARQGGDNSLYDGIPMSGAETATQMVSFPCSTVEGPCSAAEPAPDTPFPNPGQYCNNETFGVEEQLVALEGGTPNPVQWAPIFGHYVQTPFLGVLRTFRPAPGDNPFSHEFRVEPCPWPPPPPPGLAPYIESVLNESVCSSDWDVNARGLPGYAGLQSEGRRAQHIEWERHFSQAFLLPFQPHPGDLVFVSGRYIVDCGHDTPNWKTEIHPPSVVAFMRTETYNGRLSTRAQIWVNGFYSGDPVEFDIIPPPRPSPTATLGLVKADYGGTPIDVTVTSTTPGSNRVRARITASQRRVPITAQGEMKWQTGRSYYSRWNVYWDTTPAPSPTPTPNPSPTPTPCIPSCPSTCRTGPAADGCGGFCPRNCDGCCNSPTECILPPRHCE
jgi:hypothetical protein